MYVLPRELHCSGISVASVAASNSKIKQNKEWKMTKRDNKRFCQIILQGHFLKNLHNLMKHS